MATVEPKLMLLTELSNPEEKTPYMVGKIGHAPEMHNTYYRTKNGFLIPCPILFFSDSYRRPATIIYSNDQNNKPNNPQFFDDLLLENRLVVDEILAVTDGGSEYKLTTPRAPGFYLYDSFSFFNPTILRDLLKLLSEKVHKNGELAPSFKELLDSVCTIVLTSNCIFGRVHPNVYKNCRRLSDIGIIYGEDMLTETAFIKLSWLLANHPKEFKSLITNNLRGEIKDRTLLY